ncbi:hypothetical protein AB3S75_047714 [Citrus x aurantiifolia]
MPIFEGEDAYGWVYRVERYFTINGLSEREKLMAATLCLEGRRLRGFNSENNDNHCGCGVNLKTAYWRDFEPLKKGICMNSFLP